MAHPLQAPIHLVDYLAREETAPVRHEYVAGQVYAMTGGTMRHNRIAFNVARVLADRLDGTPCQVFINDVKLHVQAADSVYYPDVFVVCDAGVAAGERVAHDAVLVVEVLSDSTAATDRREKLAAYRKLPGLRAYWIVSQDEQRVEVYGRDAAGPQPPMAYAAGEALPVVDWLGGEPIALQALYAGTDLA
jgi:Uma2 family endonuclease